VDATLLMLLLPVVEEPSQRRRLWAQSRWGQHHYYYCFPVAAMPVPVATNVVDSSLLYSYTLQLIIFLGLS
jgi:hypothetical protein